MYKSLSHRTPEKICTNLSLTVSWYPYVQYKSLSHRKLAQMCTNLSLTQDTGKIYIQLSLSHSTCKLHGTSMYSTNLSLTRSWHKYVQISLSQDASKHMYKSLSHRTPVKICTNLSLTVSWYKYVQISPSQRSKSLCLPCSTTKAATP